MAAAAAALSFSVTPIQASSKSNYLNLPVGKRQQINKNTRYRIKVKTPGKLTVTSSAPVTLKNNVSWNWTLVPYSSNKRNSKVYYIRKGTYFLTTRKNAKVTTSFSKLPKNLETFPTTPKKQYNNSKNAAVIKLGQKVKGTFEFNNWEDGADYYRFTLDAPKKVTLKFTNQPIYKPSRTNVNSKANIIMFTDSDYTILSPESFYVKGAKTQTQTWYLAKGSYFFSIGNSMGRYNFKLSGQDDTSHVPGPTKITSVQNKDNSLIAHVDKADNAAIYELYWQVKGSKLAADASSNISRTTTLTTAPTSHTVTDNGHSWQVKTGQDLVNGQTYILRARGINSDKYIRYGSYSRHEDIYYGPWSKPIAKTYYSVAINKALPPKMTLTASLTKNGEIHVAWEKLDSCQSYRIAYRQVGSNKWGYLVTAGNSDTITGLTKNQKYEVKLQGLNGHNYGPYSDSQIVLVK